MYQQNQQPARRHQTVATQPLTLGSLSHHFERDFGTLPAQKLKCCQVKYVSIQPYLEFHGPQLHVFGLLTTRN